jgi:hypothetical protein
VEDSEVLLVLVPVVLAGVAQILVIRFDPLPATAVPLDLGRTWRGARLFGAHKTIRGVVVMTVACAVATAVVMPRLLPPEDEPSTGWFWFGALVGLGYVVAELPNSFVKRRLGIEAGEASARHRGWQFVVDEGDSVVGVVVVVGLLTPVSWTWLALAGAAGFLLHVVVDRLLHTTGVKPSVARTADDHR